MTDLNAICSPVNFLQSRLQDIPHRNELDAEEGWWKNEGVAISNAIDRAGTPWLRMFDRLGKRVDEILYPREYQIILRRGYRSGVVWRALEDKSLIPAYLLSWGELSKENVQTTVCRNGHCPQKGLLQHLKPSRVVRGSLNPV
jgi:hypothetical protein